MNASLQDQIAPPVRAPRANAGASDGTQKQINEESRVDFKEVLLNANEEEARTRLAQKNGGLAGAKTYDDFLKNLNKATDNARMPKNDLDKDDFLKLFVTQLQNQDPLNPKDGAEMAAQLAQFNGLEQMLNVNKTLKSLEEKTGAKNDQAFVNFLGKEAFVSDGRVQLKDGKLGEANFSVEHPVGKSTLTVKDASGETVAEVNLGPQEAGTHKLEWDGVGKDGKVLADGVYSMSLSAEGKDNTKIAIDLQSKITIEGIDLKDSAKGLFTNLGKMSFQDIVKVGNAGFSKYLQQAPQAKKEPPKTPKPAEVKAPEAIEPKTVAAEGSTPAIKAQEIKIDELQQPFSTLESQAAL